MTPSPSLRLVLATALVSLVLIALPPAGSGGEAAQIPQQVAVPRVPHALVEPAVLASAIPLDPVSVSVTWAPSGGGCARDIEVSDTPSNQPTAHFRVATLIQTSLTNYVVTHLQPGLQYHWSVVERHCDGTTENLGNASATQPLSDTLTSFSAGGSSVTITWANPSTYGSGLNFSDYRVMESFDNRNFTVAKTILSPSTLSATVPIGNTSNTIYTFYVAVDESCCGGMVVSWLTNVTGVEYGSYPGNPGEFVNVSSYAADAGVPDYLHCSVVGAGGANYTWQFGDGSSEYGSSVAHQYATAGVYPANCLEQFVLGGLHFAERLRFNVTVSAGVRPLLTANDLYAAPGNSLSFVGEGSGGVGPYGGYECSIPTLGVPASASLPAFTASFRSAGTFEVLFAARDAVGGAGMGSVNITVSPLNVSASASPSTVPLGALVDFVATASGGGGPPYLFNWTLGDGNNASGSNLSYGYQATGSYTTWVAVTDALGNHLRSSGTTVNVSPALQPGFVLHPASPHAGQLAYLNATPQGGVPPYNCSWEFGDGAVANGCNVTHRWSIAGDFELNLTVFDAVGQNGTLGRSVHVTSAPSPGGSSNSPTTSGLPPLALALLVGAVLVAAAGIGTAYFLRRRRPPRADSGP